MSEHEEILKRYEGKILGIRNYESLEPKKEEFYAADLLDLDTLYDFMWEVSDGESDFTPAGLAFVKEQYNIPKLAENFLKAHQTLPPHGEGKTDEEKIKLFVNYVDIIEPMEIALWIAESDWEKDKTGEKPSLDNMRDEFLPPAPK